MPMRIVTSSTARSLGAAIAFGAVLVGLQVGASAFTHNERDDCSRTVQHQPPDAIGVSLDRVERYLADKYATRAKYIAVTYDGPDAVEMAIYDASGDTRLDTVRVERGPQVNGQWWRTDGWLIATTNTCGD
jgi:hypothetical protein